MSANQKVRSTLTIDEALQAASASVATAVSPLRKLEIIVALANLVLRLFQSGNIPVPAAGSPGSLRASNKDARRMLERCPKDVRPGLIRGVNARKGGLRHG